MKHYFIDLLVETVFLLVTLGFLVHYISRRTGQGVKTWMRQITSSRH